MHLILLLALASVGLPGTFSAPLNSSLDEAWMQWKAEFAKVYEEGEEEYRRSVWEENLKIIEQHNREYAEGKQTYEMGMNHFGDMTDEEFQQRMKGFDPDLKPLHDNVTFYEAPVGQILPANLDWSKRNRVTPVKDQRTCDSCWVFSAVGALEGLHARKKGKLLTFSEQNIIDCFNPNYRCQPGYMEWAYEYVMRNGINQQRNYRYEGKKGPCRFKRGDRNVFCEGFRRIPRRNETALLYAVAEVGPVSVAMAMPPKFLNRNGILTRNACGNDLSHAVLLVGYTTLEGKKYWILKNSWGKDWGNQGYALLEMGVNACGITEYATFPI